MNIVFLCFFSHIIHYLQSLNVECFESLNKIYKKQLVEKNKIEMIQINKLYFLTFLQQVRKKVMTETIIKST